MRKIYQLKKTSWFYYDDDEFQTNHYLSYDDDDYSEEFYTSHKKAFKALVNHLRWETGWDKNPYEKINLFPREHFIKETHDKVGIREYTQTTKWEIIEIEPW